MKGKEFVEWENFCFWTETLDSRVLTRLVGYRAYERARTIVSRLTLLALPNRQEAPTGVILLKLVKLTSEN